MTRLSYFSEGCHCPQCLFRKGSDFAPWTVVQVVQT